MIKTIYMQNYDRISDIIACSGVYNGMSTIHIQSKTHGHLECQVDDEDYDWIMNEYHVYACKVQKAMYVDCRRIEDGGHAPKRKIHRVIYARHHPLERGQLLDHIDGNPCNNQKANLRIATHSQNSINRDKTAPGTSQYKGVTLNQDGRWYARLKKGGRYTCIAVFLTEREAAIAYDIVARHMYGEFAVLNLPDVSRDEAMAVVEAVKKPKREHGGYSQYLGVSFDKKNSKWFYQIHVKDSAPRETLYGRPYDTELEAAVARDECIDMNQLPNQKSLQPRQDLHPAFYEYT